MEGPGSHVSVPTLLLAAVQGLPEPMAIADSSGAVVFANLAWQQTPLVEPESTRPEPESLADALRLRWGLPAPLREECQSACLELGRGTAAQREIAWQAAVPGGSYRLTLRSIGSDCVLARVTDVTAIDQVTSSLARVQQQLNEAEARLNCFAEVTSETLVVSKRGKILFANASTQRMFQHPQESVVGKSVLDFAAPECHAEIIRYLTTNNNEVPYEAICVRADGSRFLAEVRGRVISYHGRPVRGAALLDITQRKRAEEMLSQKLREEERARTQSETLAALSTPLIPVSDEVLVLPLIGALDANRMARVTETLLTGVSERRVRWTIIDITGMPALDSTTAPGLIRAAAAVRLLGARVILSGVRAEAAQQLVRLGIELSSIITRSSLQSAIAYALSDNARAPNVQAAR